MELWQQLQGGCSTQGWSCGNSFREVVPLRDGAGEGLLSILGSVGRHIQGAGVRLAVAFLLVPCSWHVLGVYLQQTVLEFVERAESGFFLLDSGDGQSSSQGNVRKRVRGG